MTPMQRQAVRKAILEFLGSAYDSTGDKCGNPDYYGDDEVDSLVEAIHIAVSQSV